MTSLAVLPAAKKSFADFMDEDTHLTLSIPSTVSPLMSSGPTAAILSNLLNIPDSFMEHYNRVNRSNSTLAPPSLFAENQNSYDFYVKAAQKPKPFNAYAHPEQPLQQYPQPLFVKPELVQMRLSLGRRSRITTLDDPDLGRQNKDDDYYLFNTDIQPSQMMASKNYFNTEDALDSLLFIMNSDLDPVPGTPRNLPIPGYEGDYLMDEFAEDAEALSEDSDDDNYFQEEDDDDDYEGFEAANAFAPRTAGQPFMLVLPSQKLTPPQLLSQKPASPLEATPESDEMMLDNSDNEYTEQVAEHHMTAREISETNPNHQCELVNPSTGKPCSKQFSRPYDLIRHQETIHAAKKKIYRCVICEGRDDGGAGNGKLKTFSRGDALSRHIKVKHGLGGQDAMDMIAEAKKNFEVV